MHRSYQVAGVGDHDVGRAYKAVSRGMSNIRFTKAGLRVPGGKMPPTPGPGSYSTMERSWLSGTIPTKDMVDHNYKTPPLVGPGAFIPASSFDIPKKVARPRS